MWYRFCQSQAGIQAGLDSDGNLTIKINKGNVMAKKAPLQMLGINVDALMKDVVTSPVFAKNIEVKIK